MAHIHQQFRFHGILLIVLSLLPFLFVGGSLLKYMDTLKYREAIEVHEKLLNTQLYASVQNKPMEGTIRGYIPFYGHVTVNFDYLRITFDGKAISFGDQRVIAVPVASKKNNTYQEDNSTSAYFVLHVDNANFTQAKLQKLIYEAHSIFHFAFPRKLYLDVPKFESTLSKNEHFGLRSHVCFNESIGVISNFLLHSISNSRTRYSYYGEVIKSSFLYCLVDKKTGKLKLYSHIKHVLASGKQCSLV